MSLESIIKSTEIPSTKTSLMKDFMTLGLQAGDCIIVHSSLKSLGYVCGGAYTVILALMEVLTEQGTLIMPAHSGDCSDPGRWENPPVPKDWIPIIRESMPPFSKSATVTSFIGAIPELFRTLPDVRRSNHPQVSFCAWGAKAEEVTENHSLTYSLGVGSPLQRVYNNNGKIMLLGVGYDVNTSFHLSEYHAGNYKKTLCESPIMADGERVWAEYEDIEFKTDLFSVLGEDFEKEVHIPVSKVGNAQTKIFSQREAVDFGVQWFQKNA